MAINQSGDYSYMPQMRDNECQTRESLFLNTTNSVDVVSNQKNGSSSTQPASGTCSRRGNSSQVTTAKLAVAAANALPPVTEPPIGFTTFGKKPDRTSKGPAKEHRFRAEAVIEVERFRSPKRDVAGTENAKSNRPYSVQSTKSAPDVIVTH